MTATSTRAGETNLVGDDGFPRFSSAELAARRQSLHHLMDEKGVDHLIAYGADRSGNAVEWISEWPVTREAALLVTPGEPDSLLVQHYNHLPNARRIALGARVEWGGRSTVDRIIQILGSRRLPEQRVGVVGPMGHRDYRRLSAELGELVPLDDGYRRLRMVKSPEEVARLRHAANLSDRAIDALAREVEPGMEERQLAAIVESAYLAEGATNHIHYFAVTSMAAPEMCVPAQFQSTRPIQTGDILFCEISAAYWGYAGQVLRSFTVGADPEPIFSALHDAADTAFDAIVAVIRPGAHAAELVEASKVIEERGFTTYDDLVHGYGGGYLPPVVGSVSRPNLAVPDVLLEEGMALVVQPNVITTDERAGVQTGHLVVVTPAGCESLHRAPRGLGRIG